MRKTESYDDIESLSNNLRGTHGVNPNVNVTNLIKSNLCHKMQGQGQFNAYQLAIIERAKDKQNLRHSNNLNLHTPLTKPKRKLKRTYSQQQIQRLVNIEEQLKIQAYQLLCGQVPLKLKAENKVTAKQLSEIDIKTMKGSVLRNKLVKTVMVKAAQKYNKPERTIKKQSMINSSQSISSEIGSGIKNSMISEQDEADGKNKGVFFRMKLETIPYQKVLNTERRKQAWKAYQQAQRNKIILFSKKG